MKKNIDLLNGPIFSSLTRLAVPIMATSMVQMAYNLTDMAWIGRVGAGAVAAVGSAGMYTWLSQGVVSLAKMGGQVKVAHSLGEDNQNEAVEYARGAFQMAIIFAILYGAITVIFSRQLIGFYGLSNTVTIASAKSYLRITCGGIIFAFVNSIFTGILTASGDSKTPFQANVIGLVVNMVLDPVLIFGLGPIPAMEATGAAVATVTAQMVVMIAFLIAVRHDTVIFNKVNLFKKTKGSYIRIMVKIGLPASVQNLIYTSISMIITKLVAGWGDTAVAVQRVGSQIESISYLTADGFAAAINSYIGQNYGAKKYSRVKRGYLTAAGTMAVWGVFTTCILLFLPGPIFEIFIRDPEVVPFGISYLKILGYCQLFMCIEIMTVSSFAGLGKTLQPAILSIVLTSARVPMAILLSGTALALDGIWWAYSISSIAKGIIFFMSFQVVMQKILREKEEVT